jgi:mercuric reductase
MERAKLEITGMTCEHCARTIRKHLEKRHGVRAVRVDWALGVAEVELDPEVTSVGEILRDPIFRGPYFAQLARV